MRSSERLVELVAVDAAAGEAVVREADRWYLVARGRKWHPVDVGSQRAQFLSSSMLQVRQPCGTFEEAMAEVRRICAGAPPTHRSQSLWEKCFPDIVQRFGGLLDGFFERRGCSPDESFRLSLETFRRLFGMGPVEESEISARLRQLAAEVCPATLGISSREGPPSAGHRPMVPPNTSDLEGWRLRKVLGALEARTLRCLYFWAALGFSHEETAGLMRLSLDEVRTRLVHVATRLGRPAEQLRAPALIEACIRAVKGTPG
jgi:hypothetical protein